MTLSRNNSDNNNNNINTVKPPTCNRRAAEISGSNNNDDVIMPTIQFSRWHRCDRHARTTVSNLASLRAVHVLTDNQEPSWAGRTADSLSTRTVQLFGINMSSQSRLPLVVVSAVFVLLSDRADLGSCNQVVSRFEYKYSFKPPYLAQKDGSVPFWEYGGSKWKRLLRFLPSLCL